MVAPTPGRPSEPEKAPEGTVSGPKPGVRSHLSADPLKSRERPPVAVLPSREQLGILVDRTEHHILASVEAHSLRLGITHLAAQLGGAGKAIRRLTGELEQARAERDAALAERDAARLAVKLTGAQRIACPYCGAAAGQRCRAMRGVVPPRTPHTARLEAAS